MLARTHTIHTNKQTQKKCMHSQADHSQKYAHNYASALVDGLDGSRSNLHFTLATSVDACHCNTLYY